MRLDDERESQNIEDRRGGGSGGGGGFGLPGGGIAVGGIGGVVLVLLALFLGVDPSVILGGGNQGGNDAPPPRSAPADPRGAPMDPRSAPGQPRSAQNAPSAQQQQAGNEDPQRRFVAQVLASTEDVWTDYFRRMGRSYEDPTLVLFTGATQTACGFSQAAVGPFYCPGDHKLYIDLDFLRTLQAKLGAQGDFAEAYVIAHEVGHHVQNLLGIMRRTASLRQDGDEATQHAVSIRTELQADCFAGVWANQANRMRNILEQGDVEQGLNAAAAVGDDKIQMRSRGYVVPESFTHGSAQQRVRWFRTGLQSGDLQRCDTFGTDNL